PGGGLLAGLAFEEHPGRLRAGDDRQVRPVFRLTGEKRLIGARSPAAARCRLAQRDRGWAAAVASVVVALRDARGDRRLDKLAGRRQYRGPNGDPERAADVVRRGIDHDLVVR